MAAPSLAAEALAQTPAAAAAATGLRLASPLRILNGLLFLVWLIALVSWLVIESRRYDVLAETQYQQQVLKAQELVQRSQEETVAIANLLRRNRLVIEALLVADHNTLLDAMLPMLDLPLVQFLAVYNPKGEITAQAHTPAVFGRPDELQSWLMSLDDKTRTDSRVAQVGKRLYLLSAGRVEDLNGLGGYMVAGTLIEQAFAEKLALATSAQVELKIGDLVLRSNPKPSASASRMERRAISLPPYLAKSGLTLNLIDDQAELRSSQRNSMLVGVVSMLVAGLFMLTVAFISSRAMAASNRKLLSALAQAQDARNEALEAKGRADEASRAKSEMLDRQEVQRQRLDLLVRCSNVGSFEWDALTNTSHYSGRLKEMLGYEQDAKTHNWNFKDMVHPDDWPVMGVRFVDLLKVQTAPGVVTKIESCDFRMLKQDRQPVWVHADAIAVAGLSGNTHQFIASFVDLTVLMSAEEDTRAALRRQQELNELRSRFVAMTSHEFRTPLATILSSGQLLKYYGERLPEDEKGEIISNIESGVQRMTQMLDKVLKISKAEAGMLEFNPQPIDLRSLCENLVEDARTQCPDSTCQLKTRFDFGRAEGLFDEKLLWHILQNLLSNALKYSPAGGVVRFEVMRQAGRMVFVVADQGIGIPEGEIADLFESFQRASNVGDIPGTGLGLAIVKHSVELHGGEIEVTSQAGQGATFTVRI
ncbi:MAG: ATP-binding protein [Burkholderiaceae bacterium]